MPETQKTISLNILVIDDDPNIRLSIETYLADRGHSVHLAKSGEEGLDLIQQEPLDIVITDVQMPGIDGFEVLRNVRESAPKTDVIIITGVQEIENAFRAMREGAFDFFTKPLKIQDLSASLQRTMRFQTLRREKDRMQQQLEKLQIQQRAASPFILGKSMAIQNIRQRIQQLAPTDATALITGETGTGKELVARAIHAESNRNNKPFIAVNCSALPETLIESELFGHEKGAFTDAKETRKGHFEQAHGGTLFLDEIGDMPLAMQTRLLRALEERRIRRLGGTEDISVDMRVVSATNRNLAQAIAEGAFREDLYHRLNTVTVHLPPLRERPDDIGLLSEHFLTQYAQETGTVCEGFTDDAIKQLQAHPFPGNIRELKNTIERAAIFCQAAQITPSDLQFHQSIASSPTATSQPTTTLDVTHLSDLTLATIEKDLIVEALRRSDGNLSQAARCLGISREMIRTRMKNYEL